MKIVLAPFSSSNIAVQIKKYILNEYNITSSIVPTPKKLSLSGCGFCVKTDYENASKIREAIKTLNVNSKGIFDAQTYEKIF
ncbi:MAG: DUF3343 domain-containing protein [Ruminococcaceae bacterium]|nr:DUF3343 domain-containing protein [Oscillospiraceae bacterium]